MTRMWIALVTADYRDVLSQIVVPTLITYGKSSTLYKEENSQFLHSKIKNSKLIGFENSGHRLIVEAYDQFNKAVLAFID